MNKEINKSALLLARKFSENEGAVTSKTQKFALHSGTSDTFSSKIIEVASSSKFDSNNGVKQSSNKPDLKSDYLIQLHSHRQNRLKHINKKYATVEQ